MKTNLEKWNYYLEILNGKAGEFMDTINPLIPETFYKVSQIGSIDKCTVLNRHYSFGLYFSGKKPTNKDIEKIEIVFNNEINFKSEKAYFDYSYVWGIFEGKKRTASTAIHVKDVFENKVAFLSLPDAEIKAKELTKQNEEKKLFNEKHKKDANYNYNENEYKFLGWQNGWNHVYFDEDGNVTNDQAKRKSFGYLTTDHPEFGKCRDLKHRKIEVRHNRRGSENTVSCPICKIYWKYDCSD